jgi:hypothetical protein
MNGKITLAQLRTNMFLMELKEVLDDAIKSIREQNTIDDTVK